jgi:hypothetical protein
MKLFPTIHEILIAEIMCCVELLLILDHLFDSASSYKVSGKMVSCGLGLLQNCCIALTITADVVDSFRSKYSRKHKKSVKE